MTSDDLSPDATSDLDEPTGAAASDGPPVDRLLLGVTVLSVVVGTVLRFVPRSALWLDEALTVNISTLPLGDIAGALKRDGHPPLFYYLLNLWTEIGGTSDWWVRALPGVISLVSLPLAYLAGRRLAERAGSGPLGVQRTGRITLAVMAMLPYGIRYAAETRMYSLAITLVMGGYLLVDDLLSARSSGRRRVAVTVGAALVTAATLWAHYWSMWLLAVVGLLALHQAFRARTPETRTGGRLLVGALVAGGVLFLPWVPTLLYQNSHTGTPWGKAFGPVEVATITIQDFSGDALTSYLAVAFALLAIIATILVRRDDELVVLTSSVQPRIRLELLVLLGTIGVGWATAAVSGNTYASRYGAVVFPLYVLCVAAGVAVIRHTRATAAALVVLLVLSSYVAVSVLAEDRTQAGAIGERILATAEDDAPGSIVVACPDQIGVALQRVLEQGDPTLRVIPFPAAGDPHFVDWVDYAERNEAADPAEFHARLVEDLPDDATVHLVVMPGYKTFDSKCEQLINLFGAERPVVDQVDPAETGEGMGMWVFGPRT